MSGTLTPRLGLYKPVPGGDYDEWGYQTNSNWDEVDAGVLPLTGGTMLGMLTLFADPVAPMDAATKNYADRVWADLSHALVDDFAGDADGDGGESGIADAPSDGLTYGRKNAAWVQALPITGGNLVGTLTSDFDISSRSNITSTHAVIGDHVFAFRTGQGVGGAIGSWDTTSGRGAGFHYDAGANAMDFGPADPSSGNLLSTQFRIDATGNTYTPNVVAAGGGLHLFGDPFFGLNQAGTARRLDWAGDGAGNPRYYQSFDTVTHRFIWHGLTGDVMSLDPGNGQFTVRGNVSVPYPGSLSAGKSVLADHVLGFRQNVGYGGSLGSWDVTTGRASGFRYNSGTSSIQWGPLNADTGDLTAVLMTLDAAGNLSVAGSVAGSGGGIAEAPTDGKSYGRSNLAWTPVLPLTGGAITGNLTASGNIQSQAAVTAKTAVLGDHVYGFRTGTGFGGSIGSWDTTSNKGAGFRLNASATAMEFGTFDANSGDLTAISMSLDNIGNLSLSGAGAGGVNLVLAGTGTNPNKAMRVLNGRLEWLNSAYSAVIASLDDTGFMTVAAGLTATTGNIRALGGDISASAGHNVTAGNAVLGDHVFGFRSGAAGGTAGSWETGTGKAFGLRVLASDGSGQFGPATASTGDLTAVTHNMFATGDLQITGANAYKAAGTTWTVLSDARTKTVTGDYTHGLAEILELRPIRYTLRDDWSAGPPQPAQHPGETAPSPLELIAAAGTEFIGLVAQEAEPFMPEMVGRTVGVIQGQEVDDLRTLDMTALPLALVNAVRELDARLRVLEGAPV